MPNLQASDPDRAFVISIHCSDFHLWDVPPDYRSNEPDWWKAQQRPIDQIKTLQAKYKVPIVFGGDLFDRWKPSPELINWALKHLPVMYGISGNHDQPAHRYEDLHKSGYWTLVEAGKIIDLKPGVPHPLKGLTLHGFPFGVPIKSVASHMIDGFNVAVIHAYFFRKGYGYVGAPEERRAGQWEKKLGNFSHAFFGDNHAAHDFQGETTWMVNTGCLMRRRRDEAKYNPCVWLLWDDGDVSEKRLDCSEDIYSQAAIKETVDKGESIDPERLVRSLQNLQQKNQSDFLATANEIMTTLNVDEEVRERVMEAVEANK